MSVDFEARYRAEPDPWGYETRAYERDKYAATLEACGRGPFAAALELGGSIGVFSALLAPRCERLVTLDAAPTAVALARERLAPWPGAEARLGSVPADVPPGPYELVVASEILYYLDRPRLEATLDRLSGALAPGGRLVAVHWRTPGPERPLDADEVHAALRGADRLESERSEGSRPYLLDVLRRR